MFAITSRNLASRLLATVPVCRPLPLANQPSAGVPFSTSAARLAAGGESTHVGDWPRTKEERERAAKKYNLIPEDYEPYEETDGWGDYPNLKPVGAFNRDKYDDYDDQFDLRFYGEPYHKDADLYYWERVDPLKHEKPGPAFWQKALTFFGLAMLMPTIFYIFSATRYNINQPWKQRRQFPGQRYHKFPASEHSEGHHH